MSIDTFQYIDIVYVRMCGTRTGITHSRNILSNTNDKNPPPNRIEYHDT
jgi:hypothetical protein